MADHSTSSFSKGRKWALAFQAFVAVAALVAIAIMLNYLAARHFVRLDLSVLRDKPLSAQTLRVLNSLTNDVKVTVFFDTMGEEELFTLASSMLREYSLANSRVSVKVIDPTRHPVEVELVLSNYKITGLKDKNFILFDCEGRTKIIYQSELSDFDVNAVLSGQAKEFKRKTFNGELLFTTAIFNLANPRQFNVCFLTGHAEHDPDNKDHPHGYAKFAAVLREKCNAKWNKLSLLGTNEVPADCQLMIIAGPRLPIADAELEKIDHYLRQGGRLLVLTANLAYSSNESIGLRQLLAQWGIGVAADMVFDPKNSPTGNDLLTARMNNQHPVMKALMSDNEDLRVRLILPRAIGQSTTATNNANPDAPKITVLAATSEEGTEASEIRNGVPYRNPYADRTGIFPLIAAAEQGRIQGISPERGAMRMIVVGDSLCLDNELIDNWPPNHLFAGLAIDWLLDRPQVLLEGLVPRPLKEYRLAMTKDESWKVRWLLLGGIPGLILVYGGFVWLRRRK